MCKLGPMFGYLLIYSPVIIVLFIGTVVSTLVYRANPSRPRAIGIAGFAISILVRVVAAIGMGLLPQLGLFVNPLALRGFFRGFYFTIEICIAVSLACIIYAYWKLSRG